jgi:small subunit ribosomal protein S3
MGHKINPIGFRIGVNRTWDSRWYADRNYANLLEEDVKIRGFINKRLKQAGVSKVVIERPAKRARVTIHSARPGVIIGKKGADIERLRLEIAGLTASEVSINAAGRLGGAEIARTEWYREGRVPLHTLRADIDYATAEAHTTYGVCGIKVWIFKGEVLEHDPMAQDKRLAELQGGMGGRPDNRDDRGPRRGRPRGDDTRDAGSRG